MSIGSILVGIGILALVAAYLARPFRTRAAVDTDRAIEAWVARIGDQELGATERAPRPQVREGRVAVEGESVDQGMNYCPQCGRRVDKDDRFCSGCGTRLQREEA